MSLELALKLLIAEIAREVHAAAPAAAPKRGPGRPAKGEDAQTNVALTSQLGAPTPAAPPAAQAVANLTHAQVAPSFLAAAKAHGRDFVVGIMQALTGLTADAVTFDKVPAAKLAQAKAMLEAGPQKAAPAVDGSDLLG